MSSDDDIFITQSVFKNPEEETLDTDGVLSDIINMEEEAKTKPVVEQNFNLKMPDFSDVSDEELVKASQEIEGRFSAPLKKSDLENLIKEQCSKKTESKTMWAVRTYKKWQEERKKYVSVSSHNTLQNVHGNLLEMSVSGINEVLSYFIAEVRDQKGQEYKPNTLYELVIAIQHYFRQNGRFVNFLDDADFLGLRNVLDAKMKSLSKQGLGIQKKQAEIISQEQEDLMWKNGILGTDTPQKLLDTLVFVLGLHFALRAGQEHRNLRFGNLAQIRILEDSQNKRYLEYHEDVSKTNRGGILHRKTEPKITRAYSNVVNPERCPVSIYEKYIRLRPQDCKCDALYLRPLKYPSEKCWYSATPIGVHQLQQTIGKLCQQAGFKGHFTNHSLRATAATRLYKAGMDEQLVSEKTGHRSNAVRSYKRTSDEQQEKVSEILQGFTGTLSPKKFKPNSDVKTECSNRQLNITAGNMSLSFKF